MIGIKYYISNDSYELLSFIKKNGFVEYKDTTYSTLDEFKKSEDFGILSEHDFKSRNHNGTFYLIHELLKYKLVMRNKKTWNPTFVLTNMGEKVLKEHEIILV